MVNASLGEEQINSAAKRELGAFLCAVTHVFGAEEIPRAADLWLAALEQTGPANGRTEMFRDVTILATTELTRIGMAA
jgi:hypothetical protein